MSAQHYCNTTPSTIAKSGYLQSPFRDRPMFAVRPLAIQMPASEELTKENSASVGMLGTSRLSICTGRHQERTIRSTSEVDERAHQSQTCELFMDSSRKRRDGTNDLQQSLSSPPPDSKSSQEPKVLTGCTC